METIQISQSKSLTFWDLDRRLRRASFMTTPIIHVVNEVPFAQYPSGHGAGLEIQWALPAQVRTLPIALFVVGQRS
jgi:hypothetical protein